MRTHTELLNYLVNKYGLKSYLEIGVQNRKNNFNKIAVADKVGVDPDPLAMADYVTTSDEYFSEDRGKFDLVFLDGLHHADQVQRDFENSLKCLNGGGFIVIHDTLPDKEETTHVPRDSKVWHGDVYKFAMTLPTYEGIDFVTIDMDCGCTVVWEDKACKGITTIEPTWENYVKRKDILNIIKPGNIETSI